MRGKKFVISGLAGVGALLAAGTVLAGRYGFTPERMKDRVLDHLEDALEREPLSTSQRQAIDAALDRALAQAAEVHANRNAAFDRALAVFEADALDLAELERIKQEHIAERSEILLPVLKEVHDTLTPTQRRAVAAYARAHVTERRWGCRRN